MTVCLSMIVRNEALVIRRCLESVLPLIDAWVIIDTGSTDCTREIIREVLAGVQGELHDRPWVDFSTNRNEALELARHLADYALVVDADDVLTFPPGYRLPELTDAGYALRVQYDGVSYLRPHILRSSSAWRYEGVIHEAAIPPLGGTKINVLPDITYVCIGGGARSHEPDKYWRDVAVLRNALASDITNPRYQFYLAQSLRDAGDLPGALQAYQRRVELGGWAEEVFESLLQISGILERIRGGSAPETLQAYLRAWECRPTRAEPLVHLARIMRCSGQYHLALLFARRAVGIPQPPDALFVDTAVYEWRALDELAVAEFFAGDRAEALRIGTRLRQSGRLPPSEGPRWDQNMRIMQDKA